MALTNVCALRRVAQGMQVSRQWTHSSSFRDRGRTPDDTFWQSVTETWFRSCELVAGWCFGRNGSYERSTPWCESVSSRP